jgi:hypothetical protein
MLAPYPHLTGKKTGGKMVGSDFLELRFTLAANLPGVEATRMKAAARRRVYGAGDITF